MVNDPEGLIADFGRALAVAGFAAPRVPIRHEVHLAPHRSGSLPAGCCAAYVFSVSESYGRRCPAGSHRVLKVGKAGVNSNARFQSQHYNPGSAPSTLAGTLARSRILWPYLGIESLDEQKVGAWIRENTDRDNFYLDVRDATLLGDLERYLRARLGPAVEGG
jgi:hypothetical protein